MSKKDGDAPPQPESGYTPKCITLEGVGDGAAVELFNAALGEVLKNLEDVNTPSKTKRRIILEFVFTTNEERNPVDLTVDCTTKLAGLAGISTLVNIGRHQGALLAVEAPRQETLFPTPGGRPLDFDPKKD